MLLSTYFENEKENRNLHYFLGRKEILNNNTLELESINQTLYFQLKQMHGDLLDPNHQIIYVCQLLPIN